MLRLPTKFGPMSRTGVAFVTLLLLVLMLGAAPDGLAAEEIVSPLEPADTSSPRATLKAFRGNFDRAFRDFYRIRDQIGRASCRERV